MLEEDPRTRRSRCPLGLIGALILIIFVEIQISGNPRAVMGGSQWGYSFARRKADSEVKDCKVLCFGDSLLKQGLSPILIEAKTGLRAFNFAAGGGQAPGSYFLLRRALASGAHPSAIVVEYLPKLMSEHPNFNFQNWPFVATPLECFEMACIDRDPSLFTRLVLRQAIPSIRFRESIRLNLQLALEGRFLSVREQIDTATRHWEVNRGGEIQQSRPGRIEDLEGWMNGYFPKFHCKRVNRIYINKLMDLAAEHDIPVFWVLPPYKPELQARCEQSGFDKAHETFVRTIQARHPGLHVLDFRKSGYDPNVFTDLHHLGTEGASAHTLEIADLFERNRGDLASCPSWIEMPHYRPTPAPVPLENFENSRVKLRESLAKQQTRITR